MGKIMLRFAKKHFWKWYYCMRRNAVTATPPRAESGETGSLHHACADHESEAIRSGGDFRRIPLAGSANGHRRAATARGPTWILRASRSDDVGNDFSYFPSSPGLSGLPSSENRRVFPD